MCHWLILSWLVWVKVFAALMFACTGDKELHHIWSGFVGVLVEIIDMVVASDLVVGLSAVGWHNTLVARSTIAKKACVFSFSLHGFVSLWFMVCCFRLTNVGISYCVAVVKRNLWVGVIYRHWRGWSCRFHSLDTQLPFFRVVYPWLSPFN